MTVPEVKPTRRGRETQEAIHRAARKVISERGFLKMTVADIVKEAGKSPASFYNYYDSKEALLESWARQFQDAARQRLRVEDVAKGSARERVRAAASAHWNTYRDHLAEMIGVYQLSMINDDFAKVWEDLSSEAVEGIEGGIRAAQRQGFCPTLDPFLAARAIVSMLHQFCYENLANGRDATADDKQCIETLTELWYRAVFWRE